MAALQHIKDAGEDTTTLKLMTNRGSGMTQALVINSSGNVGVGTDSPISELSVHGKISLTNESDTPDAPSDGNGYIYTKSDGKLYWRSFDLGETDLTRSGDIIASSGTFGTLSLSSGTITDSSGDISFADENLSTTGTLECGAITSTGLLKLNSGSGTDMLQSTNELYLTVLNGFDLFISSSNINLDATGFIDLRQRTLINVSDKNYSPNVDGLILHIDELTMTDISTSASGTASEDFKFVKIDVPTLNSSNSSVITTNASTFYIQGAPAPLGSGNMTITNPYALYVNSGNSYLGGNVGVNDTDPISELSVAGKISITAESSTPSQPADDAHGYLYTKAGGDLYWRSYDIAEASLTTKYMEATFHENNIGASHDGKMSVPSSGGYLFDYTAKHDGIITDIFLNIDNTGNEYDNWNAGTIKWIIKKDGTTTLYTTNAYDKTDFGANLTNSNNDVKMVRLSNINQSFSANQFLSITLQTNAEFAPANQMEVVVNLSLQCR